jgi:hypothetical protein
MRSFKPDVIIALDFGGSLTKIIYQPAHDTPQVLTMFPEVAVMTAASSNWTDNLPGIQSPPESRAWVELDSQRWAVGATARQLYAPAGLKGVKWERAIIKTLAALWVIQQRLGLRSGFKAAIACVLPPGEFEDRHRFEGRLREALTGFETPTGTLKVTLGQSGQSHFLCLPECAGVSMLYSQQLPPAGTNAFLMLGYRNASLFLSRNGAFGAGVTSDLGFVRCIEQVQAQTSGLQTDVLVKAIAQAHQTKHIHPYVGIVPYQDEEERVKEARRLDTVVDAAKESYLQMLSGWLDEVLPLPEQPTLAFYGGTADLMKFHLNRYQPKLQHHYNVGAKLPESLDQAGLGHRLLDIYGVFCVVSQQWQIPAIPSEVEVRSGVA